MYWEGGFLKAAFTVLRSRDDHPHERTHNQYVTRVRGEGVPCLPFSDALPPHTTRLYFISRVENKR